MFDIVASIVLYNNDLVILKKAIDSFLNTSLNVRLYLIDNSPTERLKILAESERCSYVFNNDNVGFGKGHNQAIRPSIGNAKYHLVLNPDVYFQAGTLERIFSYMEQHPDVGQLMPKILYPDGRIQYSGKLLPTPIDLIGRRLFPNLKAFDRRNRIYELQHTGYNAIMNVPHHLGCFMFIRTEAFAKSGIFDERIFMYTEDIDLTRRIHRHYKTIFFPDAEIFHYYGRGSKTNRRQLFYHIRSALIYFTKWGWIFDSERTRFNRAVIRQHGVGVTGKI